MAYSINKAFILGNLTRDPELRYTPNGQSVTSFSVATNRRWKDAAGAIQEETQFHDVVAWGKIAETITQILKKGNKICVIGRLQTRNWEAPDGAKRNRTEIIMEDFVPLNPKPDNTSAVSDNSGSQVDDSADTKPKKAVKDEAPTAKVETKTSKEEEINLDDIPF